MSKRLGGIIDCKYKTSSWRLRVPYTQYGFICICMSLRVFLFAKKIQFLTKGGIHCISRSSLGIFILGANGDKE